MEYKIKYMSLEVNDIKSKYKLSNAKKVHSFLKKNFNPIQEEIYLIIVDNNLKIREYKVINLFKGMKSQCNLDLSLLFNIILQSGFNTFFIAHNHPSKSILPSPQDLDITKKIKKIADLIGLRFLDHIIFSNKKSLGLREDYPELFSDN